MTTSATYFSTQMAQITGNTGGAVQALPAVSVVGGRIRGQIANLTLASQVSGDYIHVARLPLGAVITAITMITDTSLGSSTLAFGDVGSGNSAIYAAAATLTSTNTKTSVGLASTIGAPITSGFDCITGLASKSYEDVTAVIAVANLPASGNLVIITEYMID